MFAVPGWSVSAGSLQAEKASPASGPADAKSKKRKRAGASASEIVTASNVVDLYEAVVEGKQARGGPKLEKAAKRRKGDSGVKEGRDEKRAEKKSNKSNKDNKDNRDNRDNKDNKDNRDNKDNKDNRDNKDKKKPRQREENKQGSTHVLETGDNAPTPAAPSLRPDAITTAQPPIPPKPAKLTPLQASMREKLVSARFRHLNETLYTRPSEEAFRLFQESPEMFDEYHEGFRRQVKVWPENPVDRFLEDIRTRAKMKPSGKGKPGAPPSQRSRLPLPRTAGTCTIADLGCGDARLAESLQADKSKLRLDVKSYDLQSPSPLVTKADVANLPLQDGSVNVVIFCLALMGTNWIDFVEEAYRILHWKGELWVAEIKSRFGPVRSKNAPVDHSVGKRRKPAGNKGKGARDADDGALDAQDLNVEVDGAEDRRRETDVSAFVEALWKRGFVLQGERNEAVDLSNRMFVKMHFVKGASPTKGKGTKPQEAPRGKKGFAPKWDEDELAGDEANSNEAAILKPCVYKLR